MLDKKKKDDMEKKYKISCLKEILRLFCRLLMDQRRIFFRKNLTAICFFEWEDRNFYEIFLSHLMQLVKMWNERSFSIFSRDGVWNFANERPTTKNKKKNTLNVQQANFARSTTEKWFRNFNQVPVLSHTNSVSFRVQTQHTM